MTRRDPSATAIVATRDRGHLVEDCLSALEETTPAPSEIVVVESGSRGAAEAAEHRHSVRYAWIAQPGKSRQLNEAIRHAAGEVLLFTDDDVLVRPTWIADLTAPFADPAVGIAFGPVDGLTRPPGPAGPTLAAGEAPFVTWLYAHGASMAVRKIAIEQAGGFDERLGPGAPAHGEEHDLLLRLRARGWRVALAGGPPVGHLTWRNPADQRANQLVYERGAGAFLGAALRRRSVGSLRLLAYRLRYQRGLIAVDRRFGWEALRQLLGGLAYGVRLDERDWLG